MWMKLSDGVFYFGRGGVTRITPLGQWAESRKSGYNTELYGEGKVLGFCSETVEYIHEALCYGIDPKDTELDRKYKALHSNKDEV